MKKLFLILTILAAAAPALAADGIWLEAQTNYIVYDDTSIDRDGTQFKALLGFKWFYLWAALDDKNAVDWGGQAGPGFELASFGAGFRVPVAKYLGLYIEAGKFILSDQDDRVIPYKLGGGDWEAISYYMVTKTGEPVPGGHFDTYQTKLQNGYGGQIGVVLDYPIWRGLGVCANAGYRYLKLDRHTEAHWLPGNAPAADDGGYWVFDDKQDLSGWIFGVALNWSF